MATTRRKFIGKWDNFHNKGPWPTKWLMSTRLAKKMNFPSPFARFNDAAEEIRRLLQESLDEGDRFRAYGSGWSLSKIAHQSDRMHFNARMNLKWAIEEDEMEKDSAYARENLFFCQCGNTIKELSEFFFDHGKSLRTSGASNGQSIGGAISTGVHGSAIDVGGIQDSIVGLNLIIGPNPDDVVYLERASQPALNDQFAKGIRARIIRNDELFNAALVGLGAFGFIHGVVIETVDRFLLKRYTRRIKKDQALELAEQFNFKESPFRIDTELNEEGKGERPYFFMLYINPYNEQEDFVTEIMYKKPYRKDYPNPIPKVKTFQFKELTSWISIFATKFSQHLPKLLAALQGTIFPTLDEEVEGTLAELFWNTVHKGPSYAISLALDQKDAGKALQVISNLINTEGPIPCLAGMRFVKGSEATLGFTRFDHTCILEMSGVRWEGDNNTISLPEIKRRIVEVLIANDISFTHHWGKNAAWNFPGLVDYMYGDRVGKWKAARYALLSDRMADLFTNDYLDTLQLSGKKGINQDLLAALRQAIGKASDAGDEESSLVA